MTKSSVNRASVAAQSPKSQGKVLIILSLIFRLLLLGVGGGLTWVLGMAVAQFYPSTVIEMPLAEKLLRQLQYLDPTVKRLPTPVSPALPSPTPSTSPQSQLNSVQRQKLQAELRQLQGQLNALIGRTAALETQLGNSRPTDALEKRLQLISQELAASEPATTAAPSPALPTVGPSNSPSQAPTNLETTAQPAANSPIFSANALMVTLPSDILFEPNSSILRPGTNAILDNLIADLRNYEGATVRIGGHTDGAGNATENRNLSLARAQTVQQYLSKALGTNYHWVAIGYGGSRPSVDNTSEANRQRNRRIEVAIDPRR